MKRLRVRFTKAAHAQLQDIRTWWKEHTARPEIVAEDVASTLALLSALPRAGAPYPHARLPELRRIHMKRLRSHIYYTATAEGVIVHAIWHTSRRAPPLAP